MKTVMWEMNDKLDGTEGRLHISEEKINKPEDITIENNQNKTEKEWMRERQ